MDVFASSNPWNRVADLYHEYYKEELSSFSAKNLDENIVA
jgi:hypothetical protein